MDTASMPRGRQRVRSRMSLRISGMAGSRSSKIAAREEIGVKASNIMASRTQNRRRNRAYITFMTSQQNFHVFPLSDNLKLYAQ